MAQIAPIKTLPSWAGPRRRLSASVKRLVNAAMLKHDGTTADLASIIPHHSLPCRTFPFRAVRCQVMLLTIPYHTFQNATSSSVPGDYLTAPNHAVKSHVIIIPYNTFESTTRSSFPNTIPYHTMSHHTIPLPYLYRPYHTFDGATSSFERFPYCTIPPLLYHTVPHNTIPCLRQLPSIPRE